MSSFGEDLRRQREIRSLDLDEIAAATKVARRHLEALERGDLASLPGPIFNRGFVRAYAEHVGLDPEKVLASYAAEERAQGRGAPSEEEVAREIARAVDTREGPGRRFRLPRGLGAGVAGVLLISAVLAWLWLREDTNPVPTPTPESPPVTASETRAPESDPDPPQAESGPEASTPPEAETSRPGEAETSRPGEAETSRPGEAETSTPEEAETAPPVKDSTEPPPPAPERPEPPEPNVEPRSTATERPNPATSRTAPIQTPAPSSDDGGGHGSPEADTGSSMSVSESGVGTDVVDRLLVGRGNRFLQGTRVWFWTRVVDGAAGEEIRHVWLHEGRPMETLSFTIGGAHWRVYSRKTVSQGGRWAVEARDHSGRVLAREEFLCEADGDE